MERDLWRSFRIQELVQNLCTNVISACASTNASVETIVNCTPVLLQETTTATYLVFFSWANHCTGVITGAESVFLGIMSPILYTRRTYYVDIKLEKRKDNLFSPKNMHKYFGLKTALAMRELLIVFFFIHTMIFHQRKKLRWIRSRK